LPVILPGDHRAGREDCVVVTNISRRRLLAGSAAAAGVAVVPGEAQARAPGGSGITLTWLGNNAWQITFGAVTILIDPWVTRFPTGTYGPTGTRPDTPLTIDKPTVDRYITKADLILLGHGHFDHMADVPYVAERTQAAVLGTESHLNMLRALGTPDAQMTMVRGGEYLQYAGYTVEVFESLHSLTGIDATQRKQVPFPGTRPGLPPPVPRTVADLVEGGTLAYQITVGERFRILALSTANFIEARLSGLRPDLVIAAVGGRSLHDYPARLMRALHRPAWVLPTHWDDFDLPLDQPARDFGALGPFRDAVEAASPHTTFVTLEHLQSFRP
jgi:L-ascorbate metabolism protein UlaG (beta-lactamase superfamily)